MVGADIQREQRDVPGREEAGAEGRTRPGRGRSRGTYQAGKRREQRDVLGREEAEAEGCTRPGRGGWERREHRHLK